MVNILFLHKGRMSGFGGHEGLPHRSPATWSASDLQGPDLRLAIATHLSLNDYSYVPIVTGIRATFPTGPLATAEVTNPISAS